MSLQKQKQTDGKRLACLILKTLDPAKKPPTSLPLIFPSTPNDTKPEPPKAIAPKYTDWECNLCRDIDRPHKFTALQQLRSHYAGMHDMSVSVLCNVCGQDAPKRLLTTTAGFVTYSSVAPNPETHVRCAYCHYVVVMTPKSTAKDRQPSPEASTSSKKPDKSKPLQCKECKMTFRTAYNLSMHQKARHPKAVERRDNIPLDQVALRTADGSVVELATTIDGQPIILSEAELKVSYVFLQIELPFLRGSSFVDNPHRMFRPETS